MNLRAFVVTIAFTILAGCSASRTTEDPSPVKVVNEPLVEGTGKAVVHGDRVEILYTGLLKDGKTFDSNQNRAAPFAFRVGTNETIQGFSDAVVGMKPGGKRRATIPWKLAYGEKGRPPKIPPQADLIFEIELIRIVD